MQKLKQLWLIVFVLITGCDNSMDNQEIIVETKKCHDAGLKAYPLICDGEIKKIQCLPE